MLSDISQRKTVGFHLHVESKKPNQTRLIDTENKQVVARRVGVGVGVK